VFVNVPILICKIILQKKKKKLFYVLIETKIKRLKAKIAICFILNLFLIEFVFKFYFSIFNFILFLCQISSLFFIIGLV
jgi:hypothetical protein